MQNLRECISYGLKIKQPGIVVILLKIVLKKIVLIPIFN